MKFFEKFVDNLLKNRWWYMGIAILMVLLFHFNGRIPTFPEYLFSKGFYGVDIFLFLSALGLGFSFEKNTIRSFYRNRIIRIIPIYYVLVIFRICYDIYTNGAGTTIDYLISLSGLSYLNPFGSMRFRVDWYLSALVIIYIIYPIVYSIIKKTQIFGFISLSLVSTLFALFFPLPWWYQCIAGRIPIILLGVWFYLNKEKIKTIKTVFIVISVFGILFYLFDSSHPDNYYQTKFVTSAYLCPIVLLVCYSVWYLCKSINWVSYAISFLGKHSLELYVGDAITTFLCAWLSRMDVLFVGNGLAMITIPCMLFYFNNLINRIFKFSNK